MPKHERRTPNPGLREPQAALSSSKGEPRIPNPDARQPLVGVIMGSKSDWDTMSQADAVLTEFGVAHECQIVSAHRTPAWMSEYASTAAERGLEVIIAGAGGAAHLPGMVA